MEERESEIEGIQKQLAEKDSKISSHKDTIKQIGQDLEELEQLSQSLEQINESLE